MLSPENGLALTRGPLGGQSVYYARISNKWVSSDALGNFGRALHASVDHPVLARQMAWIEEPTNRTVFAGIHRVLPCETIEFRGGEAISTFHVPSSAAEPAGSLDTLADILLTHLSTAVRQATNNSACTGIMVGGLDSCGLAAVALAQANVPIKLITLDCGGNDPDQPYVDDLARMYGVELIKRRVDDGASHLESLLLVDGVFGLPPGGVVGTVAAETLREAGADRVMTGAMGDDMLGGPLGTIGSRVLRSHPIRALALALRLSIPDEEPVLQRLLHFLVLPKARELLPPQIRRQRRRRHLAQRFSWAKPAFFELLEPGADGQEAQCRMAESGAELFRNRATSVSLADYVDLRRLLHTVTALPPVDPLLDVDLVRFTSSLPFEKLNCNGMFRGLYRRALRNLLPASVLARPGKSDVNDQIVALVRREFERPRWRALFSVPELTSLGWVDPLAFRQRVQNLSSPDELNTTWPFLAAEAFLQAQT